MPSFSLDEFLENLDKYIQKNTGKSAADLLREVSPPASPVASSAESSSDSKEVTVNVLSESVAPIASTESKARQASKDDVQLISKLISGRKSSLFGLRNTALTVAKTEAAFVLYKNINILFNNPTELLSLEALKQLIRAAQEQVVSQQEQLGRAVDGLGELKILLDGALEAVEAGFIEAKLKETLLAWRYTIYTRYLSIMPSTPELGQYRGFLTNFLHQTQKDDAVLRIEHSGLRSVALVCQYGAIARGVNRQVEELLKTPYFSALRTQSEEVISALDSYEELLRKSPPSVEEINSSRRASMRLSFQFANA